VNRHVSSLLTAIRAHGQWLPAAGAEARDILRTVLLGSVHQLQNSKSASRSLFLAGSGKKPWASMALQGTNAPKTTCQRRGRSQSTGRWGPHGAREASGGPWRAPSWSGVRGSRNYRSGDELREDASEVSNCSRRCRMSSGGRVKNGRGATGRPRAGTKPAPVARHDAGDGRRRNLRLDEPD